MTPFSSAERDLDTMPHTKSLLNAFSAHHKTVGKIIFCGSGGLDRKEQTLSGPYRHP